MPAEQKVIGVFRCVVEYPVYGGDSSYMTNPLRDNFEYRTDSVSASGDLADFVRKCRLVSSEYIPAAGEASKRAG
jgi:hypothetical protein